MSACKESIFIAGSDRILLLYGTGLFRRNHGPGRISLRCAMRHAVRAEMVPALQVTISILSNSGDPGERLQSDAPKTNGSGYDASLVRAILS